MEPLETHKEFGRSPEVRSDQDRVHPRLLEVLEKHLKEPWRAPLHAPTVAAFEALRAELGDATDRLVLDSGCGTGDSTRRIARLWPERVVVGVDKSAHRLARGGIGRSPHREGRVVWIRAELASFWRLAHAAGWRLQGHYLLYPNPWPKAAQLRRRWHGHPVFPTLLALGGRLEMRCNWAIYAQEFALAANRALGTRCGPSVLGEKEVLSPFERKYRASGQLIYSVSVSCEAGAV